MTHIAKAAALALLGLAGAAAPAGAELIRLDFTAQVQWGGTSGPGTVVGYEPRIRQATGVTTGAPFAISGHVVIDDTAPVVVGFPTSSGYWSVDAINAVSVTVGSQTFTWGNAPGTTNLYYGLSLVDSPTTDRVSTGSISGPLGGGLIVATPQIEAALIPDGDLTLRMSTFRMDLNTPGLIDSAILADQAFDWGGIGFGADDLLLLQFEALYTDSLPVANQMVAQNLSGYFTSFALHDGGGEGDVPEPAAAALFGMALAELVRRKALRRA
jgi:hypothetical protein